jgi:uncharacterized protein (TIGR03086 family)
MSENLRAYTKALYTVDGVVRRLREFDWDTQSPNREWTARQTLGHVIWGVRRIANAARGEETPAPQAEAEVAGDDPIRSWSEAMDNVLEALDHHGVLSRVVETPFGSMTVDEALGRFFADPLTHAWDIARSAGVDAALPPELAQRGMAVLAAIGDALRGPGRLEDPVDIEESASSVDKFIAYTGRDPR